MSKLLQNGFNDYTKEKAINLSLRSLKVKGYPILQKTIDSFVKEAIGKSELKRISVAENLVDYWKKKKYPESLLPIIPKKNDFWYFVQLLTMKRHLNNDGSINNFNISDDEELLIEDFTETDYNSLKTLEYFKPNKLLKILYETAKQKGYSLTFPATRFLARKQLDYLIKYGGLEVIDYLGLDNKKYRLAIIPYDIYLRLDSKKFGNCFLYTHFDGYRLRTDKKISGLIGGNKYLGGKSFIDSFWIDRENKALIYRLVIIRKNYGC